MNIHNFDLRNHFLKLLPQMGKNSKCIFQFFSRYRSGQQSEVAQCEQKLGRGEEGPPAGFEHARAEWKIESIQR